MKSDSIKGFAYAFMATIAISNVYLFSKAALNIVSLATFGFYWFLFGMGWFLVYLIIRGELGSVFRLSRSEYTQISLIGILQVVGTAAFFTALNTIENPSVVSFLGNMGPIFVATLSYLVLKERFGIWEIVGMSITFLGIIIISYKSGNSFSDFFIDGIEYIFVSTLTGAIVVILIKRGVAKVKPIFISFGRTFMLFIASSIYLATQSFPLELPTEAFNNILAGSFLGPFMSVSFSYLALKYIKATQSSIIGSTKSFFVLLGGYFYFGHLPLRHQIIGGTIAVLGVMLTIFAKQLKQAKRKAKQAAVN